jgi:transposase
MSAYQRPALGSLPLRAACTSQRAVTLPRAAEGIESPYDVDARSRHKHGTSWTGSMVHVSETCDATHPHLLTHVHTTSAAVHEASCTEVIHQALVDKALAPTEQLVDGASIDAELLHTSQQAHGITLRGPTRPIQGWQTPVEGAYTVEHFAVAWQHQTVVCPPGTPSRSWHELVARDGHPYILVSFSPQQCRPCPRRPCCTQSRQQGRRLRLPPQAQYEALQTARAWYTSDEGQQRYKRRAGVEGPLSQGVRAFGLRRTRYRGLDKTHVQHVATAVAINSERMVAWLEERIRYTWKVDKVSRAVYADTTVIRVRL